MNIYSPLPRRHTRHFELRMPRYKQEFHFDDAIKLARRAFPNLRFQAFNDATELNMRARCNIRPADCSVQEPKPTD